MLNKIFNRSKNNLRRLFTIGLLLTANIQGCALIKNKKQGMRLSQIRPELSDVIVVDKEISRQVLLDYLGREDLVRSLRVVEIFERDRPGAMASLHEYRLFNISDHSVYHLLGLQNADVLVAASDVIVVAPELFKDYVRLLANENEATIELRRAGKPLILRYKFT